MHEASPIAPTWIVLPMAAMTLVVIAGHLMAMQEATRRGDVPASRWRIRACNGVIMLFTVPLIAYAFGIATPDRPGAFMLAWTSVTGLLTIILLLAAIDMLNTWRLLNAQRKRRRTELRDARRELIEHAMAVARSGRPDRLPLHHDEPGEPGDR